VTAIFNGQLVLQNFLRSKVFLLAGWKSDLTAGIKEVGH
jgi:hypothetical protein